MIYKGDSERTSKSSSMLSEEISQTWMNDPEWHRYSSKLEKIARWQDKVQRKHGFDPFQYFGGINDSDDDLGDCSSKDPRFSKMFGKDSTKMLHNQYLSEEMKELIQIIKNGLGKDLHEISE